MCLYFYPRPPGGGRQQACPVQLRILDFYPRPPGGGRPRAASRKLVVPKVISIHALRVEGDIAYPSSIYRPYPYFYPRPPGGGRPEAFVDLLRNIRISIHALRVEGDYILNKTFRTNYISIHALRVEGDGVSLGVRTTLSNFYPRPPGGGRPLPFFRQSSVSYFYPRPPGGGRLTTHYKNGGMTQYFYPRPPGGGRRHALILKISQSEFLSTPSGWRATLLLNGDRQNYPISIHALRVEGDKKGYVVSGKPGEISIHALRVEGDLLHGPGCPEYLISIHALRVEGDWR